LIGIPAATHGVLNPRAEELKRRTFAFGLAVVRLCRTLRGTWEGREFSDQLFRSGTRVGANYRAACRARSHRDFIAKIGHVVEEADETVYWLEMISAAEITRAQVSGGLLKEAGELSAMFNRSQLTAKRNAGAYKRARSRRTPAAQPSQSDNS
jgi:four helix bundle protein